MKQETTGFNEALGQLESGVYSPAGCATEAQWRDAWMEEDVSAREPLAISLTGGALADRLAWVFHAGYQGMMRYAFPFCPAQGWASYLVAEDRTGEYPGTVLTKSQDGNILSGSKSWVAASDHVDHLIVRMSDADQLVLIEVEEPGVTLSSRDKPGFLAELSQGFATFENVIIGEDRTFTPGQLSANFEHSEPYHVLTALNAFMISHAFEWGGDEDILAGAGQSLRMAGELEAGGVQGDEFCLGVADLDAATTATAGAFEAFIQGRNEELFQRWQKDRGVVNMFSKGLQKRARWLREY